MFRTTVICTALAAALMVAPAQASGAEEQQMPMYKRFEAYKAKHGRVYKTAAEEATRFAIFASNCANAAAAGTPEVQPWFDQVLSEEEKMPLPEPEQLPEAGEAEVLEIPLAAQRRAAARRAARAALGAESQPTTCATSVRRAAAVSA